MLTILKSAKNADFSALSAIYEERILTGGKEHYPREDASEQYLLEQQAFYSYVRDFLENQQGIWALWSADGSYKAACRLEQYRGGYLLTGLETQIAARGKGYAAALVNAVLEYLAQEGVAAVYSHVAKDNHRSLAVHKKCGFSVISDTALLLDGSADNKSCTLCRQLIK